MCYPHHDALARPLAISLVKKKKKKKETGEEKLSVLKQALIHPPAHTAEGGGHDSSQATFIQNLEE